MAGNWQRACSLGKYHIDHGWRWAGVSVPHRLPGDTVGKSSTPKISPITLDVLVQRCSPAQNAHTPSFSFVSSAGRTDQDYRYLDVPSCVTVVGCCGGDDGTTRIMSSCHLAKVSGANRVLGRVAPPDISGLTCSDT